MRAAPFAPPKPMGFSAAGGGGGGGIAALTRVAPAEFQAKKKKRVF
jgi:hypothetical protein